MKNLMKKESFQELLRYGITGASTTAVNYTIYILLVQMKCNYLIANTVAWIFAVAFAYITNRKMVFRSENGILQEFTSFTLMRLITLLIENLLLFFFIQLLSFSAPLSKLAVSVVTIVGNYVICKCHIFTKGEVRHE